MLTRATAMLVLLAGLALIAAARLPHSGLGVFTDTASVPGNTFTTAASFPCPSGNTGLLNASANSATTGGNGDGYETNPTNAYADGGGFAVDNSSGGGDRHRFFNYSISIPAGCSITGFVVQLDWWLDSTAGTNSISVELSWNGGTSYTAAQIDSVETTTEHTTLLGGSADTWGRTWTVAETSNANFRVRVTDNTTSNPRTFRLDWVPVQVYYGP